MVEVGYLHIDSPIAVISSNNRPETDNAVGLILLDGFDLDVVSPSQIQSRLSDEKQRLREWREGRANFPEIHDGQRAEEKEAKKLRRDAALGLCATCSEDGPLLDAARIAAQNLCLLELKMSSIRDPIRLLELIPILKRSGVTLSLRIRPEDLSNTLLQKLNESERAYASAASTGAAVAAGLQSQPLRYLSISTQSSASSRSCNCARCAARRSLTPLP